ncbi:hypothetical protein BGZ65_009964 [Modicella reniformis]|uniref:Uncharacterized protein n=1 Tax=Modicella reniformis TaxID=1440133 RepID=A0A9P6ISH6_9FUNG|nr:hypothetical protein BGZ65_009964 [Modicella reniformis]
MSSRGKQRAIVIGANNHGNADPWHRQQQQQHEEREWEREQEQQPDWWVKKSPWDYYQQVPSREELYRPPAESSHRSSLPRHDKQELTEADLAEMQLSQRESTTPHDVTATDSGRGRSRWFGKGQEQSKEENNNGFPHRFPSQLGVEKSEKDLNNDSTPNGHSQLSPIQPLSPIGSIFTGSSDADPNSRPTSMYIPPPPVDKVANSSFYQPSRPSASFPIPPRGSFKMVEDKLRPSTGFYDFLESEYFNSLVDNNQINNSNASKQPHRIPASVAGPPPPAPPMPLLPPPIPRTTRPNSANDSSMTALVTSTGTGTGTSPSPMLFTYFPPPPSHPPASQPAAPTGGMEFTITPPSPALSYKSSFSFADEPRMGGRMPRTKRDAL